MVFKAVDTIHSPGTPAWFSDTQTPSRSTAFCKDISLGQFDCRMSKSLTSSKPSFSISKALEMDSMKVCCSITLWPLSSLERSEDCLARLFFGASPSHPSVCVMFDALYAGASLPCVSSGLSICVASVSSVEGTVNFFASGSCRGIAGACAVQGMAETVGGNIGFGCKTLKEGMEATDGGNIVVAVFEVLVACTEDMLWPGSVCN